MSATSPQQNRQFTWFTPSKRKASDYESYTLGQQSYPDQWLDVGWPLCFEDGRAPFTNTVTSVRCSSWGSFRDPDKTMNRPYVAQSSREQQSLSVMIHETLQDDMIQNMNPVWRDQALGKYYSAWPFVEYGQFISLAYAVREVMVDTLTYALTFQSADKIRHQQDIVHLFFALKEAHPEYSDDAARPAWLTSKELVPTREIIERVVDSNDWAEVVLVLNLIFEPLVGELFKTEFICRNAASNGDPVTPMIIASVRRDSKRHQRLTHALVTHLLDDDEFGNKNRDVINGWLAKWTPLCMTAARAMQPLFEIDGIEVQPFESSLDRVITNQRLLITELGLQIEG
jgi:hypothetical protein